jgi:hypothetical protein
MSEVEKAAAHRLLQAMISTQGYLKATGIMGLESVLHEIQAPEIRDYFSPDFYFLSVFGRLRMIAGRCGLTVTISHCTLRLSMAALAPRLFFSEQNRRQCSMGISPDRAC